ncbi:MAG: hypothetical protein ACRCVA_05320, partial [Phreatobacter sp.]
MPRSIRASGWADHARSPEMTDTAVQFAPPASGSAAWRRFRRHKLAMAGAVTIAVLALGSVFGPWLLPFDDTY